jgi:Ca-activated chloride channel family protein
MGLLAPLGLALAALSIPILILYMLRLRRRDVLVSSTLLWQRLLRDREANAPWQRLRRNLLLFLQLLILALLTLAMARPFVPAPVVVRGSVVVLLDTSASMQARDVADDATRLTRFDAAVRAARDIVGGLGTDDVATIIAVGSQPEVLASATSDHARLRRALDEAAPGNGTADWESAFAVATASLTGAENTKVVIISDGAMPAALPALPGEVRFVGVGGGSNNLAIVALAVRESAAGPQAFGRVANYGDEDVETLIEFLADGSLFDARRLVVPAGESANVALSDLPYDMRILQARLADEDALPLDDVAWAIHTPPASGRILLVSEGNIFLERALSTLPDIELVRLSPDQPIPSEAYDLYVIDAIAEGAITGTLPGGNTWLIGPQASLGDGFQIEVGVVISDTAVVEVASEDALMRYVDWGNVHVVRAREVEPPPGARVLVDSQGGPLVFVAERPEGRLAVIAFDLHDSDLPLQIAFPILTANLVNWLLPQGAPRFPAIVHPGEPVAVQPGPDAAAILVTAPDGKGHRLEVGEQMPVFAATEQLGTYLVEYRDSSDAVLQSAVFAVNLFDETESDIAPSDVVQIGRVELARDVQEEEGRREFWPWLAGAALGVFVVEWWAYQKGSLPWTGVVERLGIGRARR